MGGERLREMTWATRASSVAVDLMRENEKVLNSTLTSCKTDARFNVNPNYLALFISAGDMVPVLGVPGQYRGK